MSGDGMELLYLEDSRGHENYKAGRLDDWERDYYEDFHNILCTRTGRFSVEIQREIIAALNRIEKAIKSDPAHMGHYLAAKEHLELADSAISFCIND